MYTVIHLTNTQPIRNLSTTTHSFDLPLTPSVPVPFLYPYPDCYPSLPPYPYPYATHINAPSASQKDDMLGLGRVLIWLMAPVAAEYLKYGKTVVSDPRRSVKLLKVLESVQLRESSSSSSSATTAAASDKTTAASSSSSSSKDATIGASGVPSYAIPRDVADQGTSYHPSPIHNITDSLIHFIRTYSY